MNIEVLKELIDDYAWAMYYLAESRNTHWKREREMDSTKKKLFEYLENEELVEAIHYWENR